MKRRLVELVRCPVCRGSLDLYVFAETREELTLQVESPRCREFCALHDLRIAEENTERAQISCHECYSRDVSSGLLNCGNCALAYPIVNGVPRLVRSALEDYNPFFLENRRSIDQLDLGENMSEKLGKLEPTVFDRRSNESFSLQWDVYQYKDKTWFKDDVNLRRREFLQSMDLEADDLRQTLLLDAGCGNGRLTASMADYEAEVVGMDLSTSVDRANLNRHAVAGERAPFVHFVQGNILEPPLAEEAFDHIHTSGVLHHTPDPVRAFRSFLSLGRTGGRAYVQLYRRREAWVRITNQILRFFTTRLPVRFLYRLCYLLVPVHTALVVLVAWLRREKSPIRHASRRERAVSMFDHFSPRYQFRYRPEELKKTLESNGLRNVRDVTFDNEARHMIAFLGDK